MYHIDSRQNVNDNSHENGYLVHVLLMINHFRLSLRSILTVFLLIFLTLFLIVPLRNVSAYPGYRSGKGNYNSRSDEEPASGPPVRCYPTKDCT